MNRIKIFIAFLFLGQIAFAQTAPPADLVSIEQNFKKLDVLGSVLYVAAHPDDENTRLLAYLANEKHYRTGYLSMTRGDGGQNLLGNEQGELLGLIRTQELLAARRVDGAEQFFTRANDFGFSKGPGETLKIWDKDKVLSDVVWVIRKFRPDVIICRFPTTGEGGHGHHTASAILAQEAFAAAADPNRYPEQLKYVQVWQAKRLLWNTFSFGTVNTTAPDQFKIDVGVYNPIIGKGYGEMAAESRSNHKTQGFGSARQRGESYEFFKTILGDAPQTDLMDGVNTGWGRVKGGEAISRDVEKIRKELDVDNPDKSVPTLVRLSDKLETVKDEYWRAQKTKELNDLIAACAGLWFESYAAEPVYALGDTVRVKTQVIVRGNNHPQLVQIVYPSYRDDYKAFPTTSVHQDTTRNSLKDFDYKFRAGKITQPYWLVYNHGIGTYNTEYLDSIKVVKYEDALDTLQNLAQKTLPENIPYSTKLTFAILGKEFEFVRPIKYKHVDPARGELYEPLVITPPVTGNIAGQVYVFNAAAPQYLQVKLKAFKKVSGGEIKLDLPKGWKSDPESIPFKNKSKGDEWNERFMVTPSNSQSQNGAAVAAITVDNDQRTYSYGIKEINYNHIPNITLFPPAQAKLLNLDLKLAGKKIGYIEGAGDLVPDALRQAGYDVHELGEKEIMNDDLSGYDAIITGVRAYNVNPRLAVEQPKLLEYVKNGGNLVVQYNNNAGLVTKNIGPYPFNVVNRRVTDEDAKVNVLDPQSPLLNYPNKITDDDFNGWVQERGLYFVGDPDSKYSAPLEMKDPGEGANKGALIVGNYGQGRFVYTSLAFFRQLPAGVPGAYRLFINLLSKPKSQP